MINCVNERAISTNQTEAQIDKCCESTIEVAYRNIKRDHVFNVGLDLLIRNRNHFTKGIKITREGAFGYSGTFRDVADGADYVRTLATLYPIDTARIVLAGHSAGGQLALWLASRHSLDRTSPLFGGTPMPVRGVVSVGGIADLREFYGRERNTCGNPAVESLLGGIPDSVPARLRDASPIERLPLGVPSVHIAGDRDFIAPVAVREAYVTAATARGDKARVVTIVGDGHFEAMTPYKAAGRAVIDAIRGLLDLPPSTP